MAKWLIGYVGAGAIFAALDAVWLRTMMPRLYKPEMGPLLTPDVRMTPAIIFYLLYIGGMVYFAVAPALAANKP